MSEHLILKTCQASIHLKTMNTITDLMNLTGTILTETVMEEKEIF